MSPLASVLLGLIVPIAWGLGSAWIFDKLRARRTRVSTDNCEASER